LAGRDITGYIDGTANPQVRRAGEVALVPLGQPGEGGSHVLTMRWVHDLIAFNRLPVDEQQRVFGRTKPDSVELPATQRPPTAHIARVETTVDGKELEIFRRSVPYGTAEQNGLYFVAFSADRTRFDRMLARMFGTAPDGLRDRLTDFSRPGERRVLLRPIAERIGRAGRVRLTTRGKRTPFLGRLASARFWLIITNVERKIASSETIIVSNPNGCFSTPNPIQQPNQRTWM
jgi:Dyp-type peroxidase family